MAAIVKEAKAQKILLNLFDSDYNFAC